MSYTIFYRNLFIKTNDMFIVNVESGCSNVYTTNRMNGKEMRARDWNTFIPTTNQTKSVLFTKESYETLFDTMYEKYIKKVIECAEEDRGMSFGWFEGISIYGKSTRTTLFKDFKNFFNKGLKNAVTVEQLIEKNVYVSVVLKKLNEYSYKHIKTRTVHTTNELLDAIDEMEVNAIGEEFVEVILSGRVDGLIDSFVTKRDKSITKPELTSGFKIMLEGYGYFDRKKGRRIEYSGTGKVFKTFNIANKKLHTFKGGFPKITFNIEEYVI